MREWNHDLGVVDTIYEEEDQEEEELEEKKIKEEDQDGLDSISPVTPSPTTTLSPPPSSSTSFLSPPPSLHTTVEEWSRTTGYKTDVVIRVHDRCFHLHRDPLISRSGYLRRRLTDSSTVTVSPPSTISADTFAEIAIFCYSSAINLSPSNIAAVKIAAEFLEMDDENDGRGNGNLAWQAEAYLQEIAGDKENVRHALRACLPMLPAAATIAVRCLEALAGEDDGGWMGELTALTAEKFFGIAESMRTWFPHDHDLLYRIVDYYLENHSEKLTEEEKSRICFNINCTNLSQHHLLHLVQNPRLPLRFVVQAMLVDQLHTRHTFLHLSASTAVDPSHKHQHLPSAAAAGLTLGAILQRDAALRQASHLRASMEATSFRIESLERDLDGLRRRLRWSEEKRAEIESARASSFRVVQTHPRNNEEAVTGSGKSCKGNDITSRSRRRLGRRLMNGLKSMFQASPAKGAADDREGEETRPTRNHRRNNSFT